MSVEIAPSGLSLRGLEGVDRRRLGGPALRTFANIADEWRLSERDRLAVLGQPGRSTYHGWLVKARSRRPVSLPLDTLLRLSGVFGIYKSLKLIFVRQGEDLAWLAAPNSGEIFGGQTPLALLAGGTQDGILLVRRHLDAWLAGQAAGPLFGAEVEQTPIEDSDLVFL